MFEFGDNLLRDVTYLAISLNDQDVVGDSLSSALKVGFHELILVDGGSSDGTRQIANHYGATLLEASGGILAQARKGIEAVRTRWVLLAELDHLFDYQAISTAREELLSRDLDILTLSKRQASQNSFWDRGLNFYYEHLSEARGGAGRLPNGVSLASADCAKSIISEMTIGTDFSYDKEFLEATRRLGLRFGVSRIESQEIRQNSSRRFILSAKAAGGADSTYWRKYAVTWPFARKIRSLLHPAWRFYFELPRAAFSPKKRRKTQLLLYSTLFGTLRYVFWILAALRPAIRRFRAS